MATLVRFLQNYTKLVTRALIRADAKSRKLLLIIIDCLLIYLSIRICSYMLFIGGSYVYFHEVRTWLIAPSMLISIPTYLISGQYRSLSRYAGSRVIYQILARNSVITLLLFCLASITGFETIPKIFWFIICIFFTGFQGFSRILMSDILQVNRRKLNTKLPIVSIYGAGNSGVILASSIKKASTHKVLNFIDDNPNLIGRNINGIPIISIQELSLYKDEIDQIFLAIPSMSKGKIRFIYDSLKKFDIPVMVVPSIQELIEKQVSINSIRPIAIDDLLGRESMVQDTKSLGPYITGKVIFVSGAGGSIGCEICRQIVKLEPSRVILLDHSEPSLYYIHQELKREIKGKTVLEPILGSACDPLLIQNIFTNKQVEIVFHAAAYKHVPLVEMNPLQGLSNNFLSIKYVCEAAESCAVKKLILISTDKAVRPTNIMGASKRLSEIIVQGFSNGLFQAQNPKKNSKTCFSMVRFGNVLNSSGSVIPLFQNQIDQGGPITLTHPDIIRYFMTIPEATQLVMQATALAKGGEVFLLDMGNPVKIKSLAEQMINLSGLTLKNEENPEGDIEIIVTGLRPGEKLYEELLINAKSEPTNHPLIYQAKEEFDVSNDLVGKLEDLKKALENHEKELSLEILSQIVPEWKRESID